MDQDVLIAGGGLAGCEAAWQVARRGLRVRLLEMRPRMRTPAHETDRLAELVCSNSLKSERLDSPSGLLKAELDLAGSLLLTCARRTRVPAGNALAVDRRAFAEEVTGEVEAEPLIEVGREELRSLAGIRARAAVLATGPLTSPALAHALTELTGRESLYFYDAVSPVFLTASLDLSRTFTASRYDKAEPDYVNCPLTREEYDLFCRALVEGEVYPGHSFERPRFFRGCLPLEEMARRGPETLAHGPLRPVGIMDPRTGRRPYAVAQLRRENMLGTLYGAVGFQTRLRHAEQERIFRLIPALAHAEFARYGSVHRNTYLSSPQLVRPTLEMGLRPGLFVAGCLVGSEGYVEAIATGLLAGWNAARFALGEPLACPPADSMLGALVRHLAGAPPADFQPMNANFGLLPPLDPANGRTRNRSAALVERARHAFGVWLEREGLAGELARGAHARKEGSR